MCSECIGLRIQLNDARLEAEQANAECDMWRAQAEARSLERDQALEALALLQKEVDHAT